MSVRLVARLIACIMLWSLPVLAQEPTEIRIGHLHASSGSYASFSMPVYNGLKLWVDRANAEGGAFVKAYHKKIPLRLISYDDQSVTITASTLANQLITQDKVDVLVSDAGSVLTSVIAPIAREHKMLLFDPNGSGATLFSNDNPYMVLTSAPSSAIWPRNLAEYLVRTAKVHRVALIYCTNEFTAPHASALVGFLRAENPGVEIVANEGVPTTTSNYTVLLNRIAASKPDAVIELGYPNNDIAFLRNVQESGQSYPVVFAIYPGLETDLMLRTVGAEGIRNVVTYVTAASLEYTPNTGMSRPQFRAAWDAAYANSSVPYGWNAIQGYTAGLVVGQALADADSPAQLDLRAALVRASGHMQTIDGPFILTADGSQAGEIPAIGQLAPDGKDKVRLKLLYPPDVVRSQSQPSAE
jgi:branched-chain amino acid transport system substrate-binding protein